MKNISFFIKAARPARLAAAVLCAALLAGCGRPAPTATPTPSPEELPTAAPTAKVGSNTIMLPMPEGAKMGNPLLATTREMSSIYGLVFESLLEFDDSGTLAPCLAEKFDKDPDNDLKWTFTLRSGARWQGNGQALTAEDVAFTLDQIKKLGTGANKPWGYITDKYINTWQANDDGTLTIELKQPFYGALHALTFPVLPKDGGYQNGGAPAKPVGTGAYVVTNYVEGKSIELAANPDWWKKPPFITLVEVLPFPDNATAISSLVLKQLGAMQTDDLTVTQYRDTGDAKVLEYPTRYFEFIAFNFTSPDIKDKRIRQAIAYALDRREIVSYTYVNHAIVCDTPIPPDSWLYDGKLLQYNHDVEQARRLLELAGWKDTDGDKMYDMSPEGDKRDLTFTLLANREQDNMLRNDAAALMAGQLEKAGIKVTVKAETTDDYKTLLAEKRFDMALCGSYLSPVPDYTFLLGTDGALNIGGYSNADMDTLLSDVLKSPDTQSLKVQIGELQNKIIDDLPIISLYFRTHSLLTSPNFKGVTGAREDSAYSKLNLWYDENAGAVATSQETYAVTLDYKGGTGAELPKSNYFYGEKFTLPAEATKTGYTLVGWDSNGDGVVDIAPGGQTALAPDPPDSLTSQTYAAVYRSSGASLSGITLSDGAYITPAFSPEVTSYTVTMYDYVGSVTITPSKADTRAAMLLNSDSVASIDVPLSSSSATSKVTVALTAEDGTSKNTYTITVKRAAVPNLNVSKIALTAGAEISPAFSASTMDYTVLMPVSMSSVTITATRASTAATVYIDGEESTSRAISVGPGQTKEVTVVVKAPLATDKTDKDRTYTLTLKRGVSLSAFTATPKVGDNYQLSPGGTNRMTFSYNMAGPGSVRLEVNDGAKWYEVMSREETSAGVKTWAWDGKVSGAYLSPTTYSVRITPTAYGIAGPTESMVMRILKYPIVTWKTVADPFRANGVASTLCSFRVNYPTNAVVDVYNSNGKAVATVRSITNLMSSSAYTTVNWDGKATSDNPAGLKAGTLVPTGTYTLRITTGDEVYTKSFKITR